MTDRHTTPVRRLAALVAGIMAGVGALAAPRRSRRTPSRPSSLRPARSPKPTSAAPVPRWQSRAASTGRCSTRPTRQLEFWLTIQAEDVFTNLATGQKATFRSAGTQRWWFVHDGDPATPPLSFTLDTGMRAQLVTPRAEACRRGTQATSCSRSPYDLRRRSRARARPASTAARTARGRERHLLHDDDRRARALSVSPFGQVR